jgi:SAM-dependent methyltransferase
LHLDDDDRALNPELFGSSRIKVTHGRILRCNECGFGFQQARPTSEELADLYRRMDVGIYESETLGRMATAQCHLELVEAFALTIPGRVLDIGCASGHFLRVARMAGWSVAGVEPSVALYAKTVETLGSKAEVHCSTLEEGDFEPSSFDAVTLWDVLEHVPDPVKFMKRCRTLLRPGGRLFLNVPNLDSIQARVLGRRWPLLLAEHLTYFNRRSLRMCGEKAGLKWIHFGRRRVSFSLDYLLFRLSQHGILGSALARTFFSPVIGGALVRVYAGELFGVGSAGRDCPTT